MYRQKQRNNSFSAPPCPSFVSQSSRIRRASTPCGHCPWKTLQLHLLFLPILLGATLISTSGYHISPTVSSNIFSFWLLLTVVNQIGLPGHILHGPMGTLNGPGLVPWTTPGLLYGPGLLMMAPGCRGVRGSFGMALVH